MSHGQVGGARTQSGEGDTEVGRKAIELFGMLSRMIPRKEAADL